MSKLTLTDLSNLSGNPGSAETAINANNAAIEAALENTLSRNGINPNTMSATLDMNSNRVANVAVPVANQDAATKAYVDALASAFPYSTAEQLGVLLYNRSTAEIAAGITPTFYRYPWGDVRRYGALGDNSADDTAAFASALLSNMLVTIPTPSTAYKITAQLTIPDNVVIWGSGKYNCKINHSYNGDFAVMGNGCELHDLYIEGNGGTYTGKGLVYSGTNGAQIVQDCRVINFDSQCFDFAVSAGSQSVTNNVETYRSGVSTTGTGRYAIVISATQQLTAKPRKFIQIETSGNCAFDFGGCNNVFITESVFADLNFTTDSRSVEITASRWLNQAACTLNGHQITIIGNDILPNLTTTGTGPFVIGPNSYNGTVTDGSSNGSSTIYAPSVSYTPSWTASSVNPAIGNGTLRGEYSRQGDVINLAIECIPGSTTTFGTGTYQFSVPVAPVLVSGTVQIGLVYLRDSSGSTMQIQPCRLLNAGTFVTVEITGATTFVTDAIPWTWAQSDTIRIHICYMV